MRLLAMVVVLVITTNSCAPKRDHEAVQTLHRYIAFVDSVYTFNETWRAVSDTEYIELPVYPNSSENIRVDTLITDAAAKQSVLKDPIYKVRVFEQYIPLKVAVDVVWAQLDAVSRQRYHAAQKKFERLLVE
jgi:hypothetical protein